MCLAPDSAEGATGVQPGAITDESTDGGTSVRAPRQQLAGVEPEGRQVLRGAVAPAGLTAWENWPPTNTEFPTTTVA